MLRERLLLPGAEDTIAAISTAPGRGAIAVIRLSGPRAHHIAASVLTPWRAEASRVYLAALHHPETRVLIDRVLVSVYAAPASYTGEDLVELSVHGGALVPALALDALTAIGAREALRGEFTRRAVVNGKMDVLQAEAVGDLIDAPSRAMHRIALAQLEGGLSRRVLAIRDAVLDLEALIAYDIDFPEEDQGPVASERVVERSTALLESLDLLLSTARTGELLRQGAVVVIAGVPNVGKSSLFNALVGYARAIVTEIPGTTRDALEAVIDIHGWPVRLVDTAGLHETADRVERLGIEVSERYLAAADLVLVCGATPIELALAMSAVAPVSSATVIPVRTKADLALPQETLDQTRTRAVSRIPVAVSAHTGSGMAELAKCVESVLASTHGAAGAASSLEAASPLLTRERHRRAVERARDEVAAFAHGWQSRTLPASVAAVHLRSATVALEELIGVVDVEDVLDRVFRTFCVGK